MWSQSREQGTVEGRVRNTGVCQRDRAETDRGTERWGERETERERRRERQGEKERGRETERGTSHIDKKMIYFIYLSKM